MAIGEIRGISTSLKWIRMASVSDIAVVATGRLARLLMSLAVPVALLSVAPTLAQEQPTASRSVVSKDPKNVLKSQGAVEADHGVPSTFCRAGYVQQGTWLCMADARGPNSFANAMLDCMDSGGRVADYHDWRYRRFRGDAVLAPVDWWLGPITADNVALFVNLPNDADFDGETSRFDNRLYSCAHDLIAF